MKKLGYYKEINFNHFFYPNVNQIRNILGYLFEYISKKEEQAQIAANGGSAGFDDQKDEANFEFLLKRSLETWHNEPWIMPEFQLDAKNSFVRNRRKIRLFDNRDQQNVEATKNKKIKGIHEYLEQVKTDVDRINIKNKSIHVVKISEDAYFKAYVKDKNYDNTIFDDDEDHKEQLQKKQDRINKLSKKLKIKTVRNINEIARANKAKLMQNHGVSNIFKYF